MRGRSSAALRAREYLLKTFLSISKTWMSRYQIRNIDNTDPMSSQELLAFTAVQIQ